MKVTFLRGILFFSTLSSSPSLLLLKDVLFSITESIIIHTDHHCVQMLGILAIKKERGAVLVGD